jgi:hypothetical protein
MLIKFNSDDIFDNAIDRIKEKYGFNTASKAVQYCVYEHLSLVKELEKVKSLLKEEEECAQEFFNVADRHYSALKEFMERMERSY